MFLQVMSILSLNKVASFTPNNESCRIKTCFKDFGIIICSKIEESVFSIGLITFEKYISYSDFSISLGNKTYLPCCAACLCVRICACIKMGPLQHLKIQFSFSSLE